MKRNKYIAFGLMGITALIAFVITTAYSQEKPGELSQIILYQGEKAGTGTGIISFKPKVGEEMTVTAQGVDKDGKDVPIWPTWKADKELSIKVVEGRSKTVVIKALKVGAPLFFSAIYITDEGKKVVGEAMGEVKPEETKK